MRRRFSWIVLALALVASGFAIGWVPDGDCTLFGCIREQLENHEQRLEALEANALLDYEVKDLEAQRASLQNQLTTTSQELGQASLELSRYLNAVSSVETASGHVTTMRFECCGSMEPTLGANDLVGVLWTHDVSIGDIVGSTEPGCQVFHRITEEVEGGWLVTPDARPTAIPCFVGYDSIVYKKVWIAEDVWW